MTNEHLQIASKLVNEVINEMNDRYASTPQAKDYCMRRMDEGTNDITIQPTHSKCGYCFDQIIKIAEALNLHYYFEVTENLDGEPTPTMHIF